MDACMGKFVKRMKKLVKAYKFDNKNLSTILRSLAQLKNYRFERSF